MDERSQTINTNEFYEQMGHMPGGGDTHRVRIPFDPLNGNKKIVDVIYKPVPNKSHLITRGPDRHYPTA